MPSFFTSGFARKRAVTRGSSSPPDEPENTATTRARNVAEDSLAMHHNREGRPLWWNSSAGNGIQHNMPVATRTFGYLLTPSSAMIAQPHPIPGYHPLYVATPSVYATTSQPLAIMPSPTPVIIPVVPVPNLMEHRKIGIEGGIADREEDGGQCAERGSASRNDYSAVEGPEKLVHEKQSGKYYVWEKFYDVEGKAVWIHTVTGKRTREDPYW